MRVVTAGLDEDDKVVVKGLMRIRPGTKVAPGTAAAIRPPLESRYPELRADAEWTPLATGIAMTMRADRAPSSDNPVRPGRTTAELSA